MCRRANRIIVESQRDHYTAKIRDASGDPRHCWSEIRNTLHSTEPRIVRSPGESRKLSNDFATFFLNKLHNINTTIKQRIRCLHSDQLQSDAKHNVSVFTNIRPTTFKETLTVIRSMSSKSLPLDKIPTRALKSCPEMFAELITHSGNFFARSLIRLISATAVYLKVKYQQ